MSSPPAPVLITPPHTLFVPSLSPMRDLKSWTSHTLFPSGSVIIDSGAHRILSRRESGGRLLPVGVLGVIGAFASGQAVRIVIRNHRDSEGDVASEDVPSHVGPNGLGTTRPSTPTLYASASMSSSVASLSPLSSDEEESSASDPTTVPRAHDTTQKDGETEDDVVEVGRGLANYNSAQISRVKGLNRYNFTLYLGSRLLIPSSSYIAQLLGYADSEYVVENVTIRVPP